MTDDVWEDVKAEVVDTEAWYARGPYGQKVGVNIYVGWDRISGWYAGITVDGDAIDEAMGAEDQRSADTPEDALRLLLAASREYRERIDRERAEDEA